MVVGPSRTAMLGIISDSSSLAPDIRFQLIRGILRVFSLYFLALVLATLVLLIKLFGPEISKCH